MCLFNEGEICDTVLGTVFTLLSVHLQNSEMCTRKTFTFHSQRVSWATAQSTCVREGGRLAEIDNEHDQEEATRTAGGHFSWTGLNDRGIEFDWRWSTGRRLGAFVRWSPRQPDNAGGIEDCVELLASSLLNDTPCHAHRSFLCQSLRTVQCT